MRVLVAPDGFTGSLPALQVATAIGRGWRRPVSPPGSCRWPTAVTAAWRPPCTPAPLPARYPCAGPTDAGTTPSSRSTAGPRSSRSPAPADRARCRRASWPRWRRPATASVRRCSRPSMRALDASSAASAAAPAPTAAQARSPHSASSSSWPPRHRPDPDLSRLLAPVAGGLVGRRVRSLPPPRRGRAAAGRAAHSSWAAAPHRPGRHRRRAAESRPARTRGRHAARPAHASTKQLNAGATTPTSTASGVPSWALVSLAPEQVVRHAARAGHDVEVEAVQQLVG